MNDAPSSTICMLTETSLVDRTDFSLVPVLVVVVVQKGHSVAAVVMWQM